MRFLLAVLLVIPAAWAGERDVVEALFRRDVGEWARSLERTPVPKDPDARLDRFQVLVRAGDDAGLRRLIPALKDLETHRQARVIDFLIGREDWEMARYAMEQLPHAGPGWAYVFVRQWAARADADEIDRWLTAQTAKSRHWFFERLRFRKRLGTAEPLVDEAEAAARRKPKDIDGVRFYVNVLSAADAKRDLSWIAEQVRPRLAYESYRLGEDLLRHAPRVGIALLERALTQRFTEEDERAMKTYMCVVAGDVEPMLRDATKQRLMHAYLRVGEPKKSQKLLEELSAKYPDGIPTGMLEAAGRVQGASGARVIAKRVEENGTPLDRAKYLAGRGENEKAEHAFQTAWKERRGLDVVRAHAHHRFKTEGAESALALLRTRLEAVPVGGALAAGIIHQIVHYSDDRTKPDAEPWWRYLAARPVWGNGREERLLYRMAERMDRKDGDAFWRRAEALAKDAHPSRARRIGWVMTRCDAHARALPLLRDAVARLDDEQERRSALFNLYETHLHLGDWRNAEKLGPRVRPHLTPNEIIEWYSRLALTAARAGDRADALRIWTVRTNLDRGDLRFIDEMAAAGFRKELTALYKGLGATRALARAAG